MNGVLGVPAEPHPFTGVVAALYDEARCLARLEAAVGAQARVPGGRVYLSGMGPERARQAACALVHSGARALLSWGTCGALDAHLKAGDLVLPHLVRSDDGGCFAVDEQWRSRLCAALPEAARPASGGVLVSGARVWSTPQEKAQGAVLGVAADMESAALGGVAEQAGIPFLVVRVVVDDARSRVPGVAMQGVNAIGRPQFAAFAWGAARHPREALALPALARSFSTATRRLRGIAACHPATLAFAA